MEEWVARAGAHEAGWFGGPFAGVITQLGVGVRRIVIGGLGSAGAPTTGYGYGELHADGSAFLGLPLHYIAAADADDITRVSARTLTHALAVCLRFVGRLCSERAGGFGDGRVVAALVEPPIALMSTDGDGFPRVLGVREADIPYSRHSLPLDSLQANSPELMAATRLVANDLFQAFGEPETTLIGPDGALRLSQFPHSDRAAVADRLATFGIAAE